MPKKFDSRTHSILQEIDCSFTYCSHTAQATLLLVSVRLESRLFCSVWYGCACVKENPFAPSSKLKMWRHQGMKCRRTGQLDPARTVLCVWKNYTLYRVQYFQY